MTNKQLYTLTLGSNILRILASILVGMFIVPLSIRYWDTEQYSIWLVINSILAYLSISNLGMNAATSILMNMTPNLKQKLSILKKSFYIISITVIILIFILLFINSFFDNWILLVGKISKLYLPEAQKSCFILILLFLVNIPFSLFASTINGFHRVYVENIFQILENIGLILALLINIKLNGNLVVFAYLVGGSKIFVSILRPLYIRIKLFSLVKRENDDNYAKEHDYSYHEIFVLGIRCLVGGIASLVVLNTDNLVISHLLGVKEVTAYAVTFKLFAILFNIIYVFNSSIVPVIGREISKKNIKNINVIYKRTFYVILWIGGGIWIGSFLFFRPFILHWAGKTGFAGLSVVFVFGAYSYLFAIANLNNVLINTLNYIKGSVWVVILEACLNLGLSIILIEYFGLLGVALGTFLGTLFSSTIFYPIIIYRKSDNKIKQDTFFMLKHIFVIFVFLLLSVFIMKLEIGFIVSFLSTITILLFYTLINFGMFTMDIKEKYLDIVIKFLLRAKKDIA